MLHVIATLELSILLLLVMTIILALLILAINQAETASILLLTLMITMLAQLIGVMQQLVQFTTMLLFVMTRTHVLTNLAILKLDVFSHMLEHRIVMTAILALSMDAQAI
jgi:hypothetical protein